MRLFVSYTRRDGHIDEFLLRRLKAHLGNTFEPFVHAVEEKSVVSEQFSVMRALFRCHLILLIESPGVRDSPWVRLELALGRLLLRPIIKLQASALNHWHHECIREELCAQGHNHSLQRTGLTGRR